MASCKNIFAMSKKDKLYLRLKSKPKDFTFQEIRTLLQAYSYEEFSKGKTSGSRVAFFHDDLKHMIRLHRPHPSNQLKEYQVNYLLNELSKWD
jgi:hypothetical protein